MAVLQPSLVVLVLAMRLAVVSMFALDCLKTQRDGRPSLPQLA